MSIEVFCVPSTSFRHDSDRFVFFLPHHRVLMNQRCNSGRRGKHHILSGRDRCINLRCSKLWLGLCPTDGKVNVLIPGSSCMSKYPWKWNLYNMYPDGCSIILWVNIWMLQHRRCEGCLKWMFPLFWLIGTSPPSCVWRGKCGKSSVKCFMIASPQPEAVFL